MRAARVSPTLLGYVLGAFLPVLAVSVLFFVLVLEMADIFLHLVQFLQNEVPASVILRSALLYLPKCLSWALPIATLFSASYVLGSLYAGNELIAVFAAGVPLAAFALPVIALAAFMSLGFLVFEDRVVIPTVAAKNQLTRDALRTGAADASPAERTILGDGGRLVWNVRWFDPAGDSLTGVVVVERDDDGGFVSRLDARSAAWDGSAWRFSGVRRFFWRDGSLTDETLGDWSDPRYAEPPDSFRTGGKTIQEMSLAEARLHLAFLENAGLPGSGARAEYLRRFSFALTPLIVAMLSVALAGRFRRNVLLMSLLVSLVGATGYYVAQMISMLLAGNDALSPAAGAFAPSVIFAVLSAALLGWRRA